MSDTQRILVVDDDPDVTEQIGALLGAEGYEIVAVGGADEAEEALLDARPDLAIVDLMMEHQDSGLMLCRRIKRLYPGTPVIVYTSVKAATGLSFQPATPEQKSWIEADRLLDKPVRPEQLKKEVRSLLARTATKDGGASEDA